MITAINTKITVRRREVYGKELLYCTSEHAPALEGLTGRKTLTAQDINNLKILGFTVEIGQETIQL